MSTSPEVGVGFGLVVLSEPQADPRVRVNAKSAIAKRSMMLPSSRSGFHSGRTLPRRGCCVIWIVGRPLLFPMERLDTGDRARPGAGQDGAGPADDVPLRDLTP